MFRSAQAALEDSEAYDFITPFPYSSNVEIVDGQLEPRLSVMSRMAIDAALNSWEHLPQAKIVIPGETLFGPSQPNTTDLMVRRAKETADISDELLVPLHQLPDGRRLNNTYLQTRALKNYFQDNPGNVLAVPLNYHIKRAIHTLRAFEVKADVVVAEDVLRYTGVHDYDQYLLEIAKLESSERVLRFLNHFDRRGWLLNIILAPLGPRLVDVVERDGTPKLEQTTAHKKLRGLQARLRLARNEAT